MEPVLRMPDGFLWGVATSAHQNEGGNYNNQWAIWEQGAGHIYAGQRAGQATDWWNLETAAADFDRAADLGLNSLRLSVEWSRIEPEEGRFDAAALRHYAAMLGLLRARGLEPMVSLHHFTDPLWLAQQGGWENPQTPTRFVRFVERVIETLGDQATLWCTINEPNVYAYQGYLDGYFPPGVKSLLRMTRVLRQMLLAHGLAYRAIHRLQATARVGLAHHMRVFLPANPASPADRLVTAIADHIGNRAPLTTLSHGRLLPPLGAGGAAAGLAGSYDWLGLNYYTTQHIAFDPRAPRTLFARPFFDPSGRLSQTTYSGEPYGEINPQGLYLALRRLANYGKPIYITEVGLPDAEDAIRPGFLAALAAETWRARRDGADVAGFYHWTLVDNFEWADGWGLRFGLFELDPATGVRAPRTSAAVYGRIAAANGVPRSLLAKVAPDYAADLAGA